MPNTNAQQIGIFSALGFLASFLIEIPSGYFADKFGHRETLILSKVLMVISTAIFLLSGSIIGFAIGSILISLSFAFASGTSSAFMHETLVELRREKDYSKIMSKISANVSLISAILIIMLPIFTKISILFPIKINLFIDLIGLIIVLQLISPRHKEKIIGEEKNNFFKKLASAVNPGFYYVSIFTGIIGGFIIGVSGFRSVYLESLGYPIILIGLVMGLSRIIWFLFGNKIADIDKKIGIKKVFRFEIFIFPIIYFLMAYLSNPYVVGFLFSLMVGYFWSRNQVIINFFLINLVKNKSLKATILSVKNQVSLIIQVAVAFFIGFFMNYSYRLGFFITGALMFLLLLFMYSKIKKFITI